MGEQGHGPTAFVVAHHAPTDIAAPVRRDYGDVFVPDVGRHARLAAILFAFRYTLLDLAALRRNAATIAQGARVR